MKEKSVFIVMCPNTDLQFTIFGYGNYEDAKKYAEASAREHIGEHFTIFKKVSSHFVDERPITEILYD
jgi:hypothetical protein